MKALTTRILTVLAAAAIAATTSGWASAASLHSEHDGEVATAHKLALNHGRKWATDETLRNGMARIRDSLASQLAAAHGGGLDAASYGKVSGSIEAEISTIVANCTLEPKADAMLHGVLADLIAASDVMAGKVAAHSPEQGLRQAVLALNEYGRYFDDPGFRPLRNVH
ncbi:hypothetical protein [Paraburkholderia sp.]|uniref:hypothetical protein n=1 Tax=Paraburkholderia sp. TaxID=1926495 RepID=UPI0025D8451C|nr:hypothetical protein [Paraburkholderia sp.]